MLLKDIVAEYGPLKIRPYLSAERAFLGFIEDLNEFNAVSLHKSFLREGPKDVESGLRPREILGLVIVANMAMFLTDDVWVPGYLTDVNGKELPEDVAHDGVIQCISGPRKGSIMHFEQALTTSLAHNAMPDDIEAAILMEAGRKSERGIKYTDGMALIVMVDYPGELSDLRKLAADISDSNYKTIYLIANTSEKLKDFVCVILKSPGDTLGSIDVNFNRPDGRPDIDRKLK